jgi:hypothetical protein
VKQRVWLAKGYGSFRTAWRRLRGIEAVSMIRKGKLRWVAKGDVLLKPVSLASCSDWQPNADQPSLVF